MIGRLLDATALDEATLALRDIALEEFRAQPRFANLSPDAADPLVLTDGGAHEIRLHALAAQVLERDLSGEGRIRAIEDFVDSLVIAGPPASVDPALLWPLLRAAGMVPEALGDAAARRGMPGEFVLLLGQDGGDHLFALSRAEVENAGLTLDAPFTRAFENLEALADRFVDEEAGEGLVRLRVEGSDALGATLALGADYVARVAARHGIAAPRLAAPVRGATFLADGEDRRAMAALGAVISEAREGPHPVAGTICRHDDTGLLVIAEDA